MHTKIQSIEAVWMSNGTLSFGTRFVRVGISNSNLGVLLRYWLVFWSQDITVI